MLIFLYKSKTEAVNSSVFRKAVSGKHFDCGYKKLVGKKKKKKENLKKLFQL